jgi:AraC-like DNA-binding protein
MRKQFCILLAVTIAVHPTNTLLFISAIGVIQAAMLAAIIYFYRNADKSLNKFLALYILCFCVPMFSPIIQHFFAWQYLVLLDPFPILSGPMIYLYVRSFKEVITWQKAWPHLVLFGLYVILDINLFFSFAGKFPMERIVPVEIVHHPSSIIRVLIRLIQMITYFFLAGRALTVYQKSINHLFSDTSKISLNWVRWLINGYLFLVLLMAVLYSMILSFPEQFHWIIMINTAAVTPYLYIFTFKAVTQPTLWQLQRMKMEEVEEEIRIVEGQESEAAEKNQKPSLGAEKTNEIIERTNSLMEVDRVFLQAELTLQELADKLEMPAYQVSQAINEGLKKTFYDLVNGYRVEEAKRLLTDSLDRKILAVGFDSGFNSKTTFNTVFKKFTGYTPSEFRDRNKVSVHAS